MRSLRFEIKNKVHSLVSIKLFNTLTICFFKQKLLCRGMEEMGADINPVSMTFTEQIIFYSGLRTIRIRMLMNFICRAVNEVCFLSSFRDWGKNIPLEFFRLDGKLEKVLEDTHHCGLSSV